MDNTVIVAVIAAGGTVLSGLISALVANALMKYRLEQLEKKVDKHNNLIERMYVAEKNIELLKNEIEHVEEK